MSGANFVFPSEAWRAIPGCPGYEASSEGKIRSVAMSGRKLSGRVLLVDVGKRGYLRVTMVVDGKRVRELVHRLVLYTFVGPCPDGMEALHGNNDPGDCRIGNLRWGTRSENQRDRRRDGTASIGEDHPLAKLTNAQVAEMRRLYVPHSRTLGAKALAKRFGVTAGTAYGICCGFSRLKELEYVRS